MLLLSLQVALIAVAAVATLKDWRRGVYFVIVLAALQDPVRKLTIGTPALIVLSALPVWFAAGQRVAGTAWRGFLQAFPDLTGAMRLFAAALPIPVAITLSYGLDAWALAALGLFGYLAPILAIAIGFVHVRKLVDVERVLTFYCLVTPVALVGALLEYLGVAPDWPAIGTAALGAEWLRTGAGSALKLISGFYRSPDIMGWHAASVVMLGATVALHRGYRRSAWLFAPIAFAAVCLLISGRRKMIIMPIVWMAVVVGYFARTGRLSRVVPIALTSAVIVGAVYYASGEIGVAEDYYGYAASASVEGRARVLSGAGAEVWQSLLQSGVFGAGIGLATQGAQHLGIAQAQGWQESGPSRLMVELGLMGFVASLYLGLALARAALRRLGQVTAAPSLGIGLLAFGAANAAAFTVSHQVYGDVAVLTLAAYGVGMGLAAAGLALPAERRGPGRARVLAERWEPELSA